MNVYQNNNFTVNSEKNIFKEIEVKFPKILMPTDLHLIFVRSLGDYSPFAHNCLRQLQSVYL